MHVDDTKPVWIQDSYRKADCPDHGAVGKPDQKDDAGRYDRSAVPDITGDYRDFQMKSAHICSGTDQFQIGLIGPEQDQSVPLHSFIAFFSYSY